MIDSTTVRGHVSAAGAKEGLIRRLLVDHAAALRARSLPAVTIKDALLALSSPARKPRIKKAVDDLMAMPVPKSKAPLADKGYDGGSVQESLLMRGILPVIPPKSNRRDPAPRDFRRYKDRNRIERMFGVMKHQRRIATRYDETALSFASFLNLAAARL